MATTLPTAALNAALMVQSVEQFDRFAWAALVPVAAIRRVYASARPRHEAFRSPPIDSDSFGFRVKVGIQRNAHGLLRGFGLE